MPSARALIGVSAALLALLLLASCNLDRREATPQSPRAGIRADSVPQVPLTPGVRAVRAEIPNPLAGDMRALEEGRRLYQWMNCSGCHFAGGGGIGPPLMDDDWIYGGLPAQIFDSIASGRANGMPAYADKLGGEEIWQIVTYVESLNVDRERGQRSGVPRRETEAGGGR